MSNTISDLLDNYDWDKQAVQEYFVKYVPAPENLNRMIPFAKSRKLLVNFLVKYNGK